MDSNSDNTLLQPGVARELAQHRAERISQVRYRLHLDLRAGEPSLSGQAEIRFDLSQVDSPVILDFRDLDRSGGIVEGKISEVTVNGRAIGDARQMNGHAVLEATHFLIGENLIALRFETAIAPAGRPIIRHLDREDGSEYIHTLFVPMDASLAFPCFDQPDLKGRFSLSIEAPEEWTVIANGDLLPTEAGARPLTKRHRFAETRPISTYLFAFAAGPFQSFEAAAGDLPLRMLARKSQIARAREEWPAVRQLTQDGMRHLVEFFGRPFPFSKYDQVLLPGFAYGGMEHAGATFLREDAILFRATPTRGDWLGRAALILHELVHQWFGDLVTMRWFDDLWLKEGFANYMAYHAMAGISPLGLDSREIWKRFYLAHKPLAYTIDGTPGTTPIYQEVPNLKDAKSAYGAIVYQKAPSLLRALSFVIGEEAFRAGVRRFLDRHAYANAAWSDLVAAFEQAAGRPLDEWANAWIRQRGMPQVDLRWECRAGQIERIELTQKDALGEGKLWPIDAQLLMVDSNGETRRLPFSLPGPRIELPAARGQKCPRFIFANDGDYGYGRFLLDDRSRAEVMRRIGAVEDPFLRAVLWGALWDALRETQIAPEKYLALALKSMPRESDEELLQSLLERTTRTFQRYLSPRWHASWATRIEAQWAAGMVNAPTQGMRILYYRAFRGLASTETALKQLKEILAGKRKLPGIEIKPLDRWRMITALLAHGDPEAERLLAEEKRLDRGGDAPKQAYIAEAARPDAAVKRRYFDDYLRRGEIPEDWIEGSLASFNSLNQSALTLPYLKPSLAALPQVKRERKIFFVLAWLNAFIGGQTSAEALRIAREFLGSASLDRDLELKVREVMDELERTTLIRERNHKGIESQRPQRG